MAAEGQVSVRKKREQESLWLCFSMSEQLQSVFRDYKLLKSLMVIGQGVASLAGIGQLKYLEELWLVDAGLHQQSQASVSVHFYSHPHYKYVLAQIRPPTKKGSLYPVSILGQRSPDYIFKHRPTQSQWLHATPHNVNIKIALQNALYINECPSLTRLYLYGNELTAIPVLDQLGKLTHLWLSDNRIQTLQVSSVRSSVNVDRCVESFGLGRFTVSRENDRTVLR
ncbi:hypothetical protein J6590_058808 [Homalodisca vitripennis]|nr:hypothetical protein J6590_058808 [Homalodisca vitripennis]